MHMFRIWFLKNEKLTLRKEVIPKRYNEQTLTKRYTDRSHGYKILSVNLGLRFTKLCYHSFSSSRVFHWKSVIQKTR